MKLFIKAWSSAVFCCVLSTIWADDYVTRVILANPIATTSAIEEFQKSYRYALRRYDLGTDYTQKYGRIDLWANILQIIWHNRVQKLANESIELIDIIYVTIAVQDSLNNPDLQHKLTREDIILLHILHHVAEENYQHLSAALEQYRHYISGMHDSVLASNSPEFHFFMALLCCAKFSAGNRCIFAHLLRSVAVFVGITQEVLSENIYTMMEQHCNMPASFIERIIRRMSGTTIDR